MQSLLYIIYFKKIKSNLLTSLIYDLASPFLSLSISCLSIGNNSFSVLEHSDIEIWVYHLSFKSFFNYLQVTV